MAKTGILIFSRHAKEEARQKKWDRQFRHKDGQALASGLIRHTLRQARESGLPVLPFFSEKQSGETFGERLADAIEKAFALGYQKLIICGTDSPSVNNDQFKDVAQKLERYNLVLAPSEDGGVYLIGLQKEAFSKKALLQIPWLTAAVFSSLKSLAAHHNLSYSIQQKAADIDSGYSVLQWQQEKTGSWFTLFVDSLLQATINIERFLLVLYFYPFPAQYIFLRRGPPARLFPLY